MEKDRGDNIHKSHRKRLKETFLNSFGTGLSDVSFLEYVLFFSVSRKDTNQLSHGLLEKFGSFSAILDADFDKLKNVPGAGDNTALFLSSLLPVFERYEKSKEKISFRYDDRDELKACISSEKSAGGTLILFFDSFGLFTSSCTLDENEVTLTQEANRKISDEALKYDSSGAVIVRKHSYSITKPTSDDIHFLSETTEFFRKIGITVYDYVIAASEEYFFFSQQAQKCDLLSDELNN